MGETKKPIEIILSYDLSFCSERESEGWSSGFKTLRDFMGEYNMKLIGNSVNYDLCKETNMMQNVRVEQRIIIPSGWGLTEFRSHRFSSEDFKGKNVEMGKPSCKHLGGANASIDPKYDPIGIDKYEKCTRSNYFISLLWIEEINQRVVIQEENDYEWTLGRVNHRYRGPYSLDKGLKKVVKDFELGEEIDVICLTEEFTSFHYLFFYSEKMDLSFYSEDVVEGLNLQQERTFIASRGDKKYKEWEKWKDRNVDWLKETKLKLHITPKDANDLQDFLQGKDQRSFSVFEKKRGTSLDSLVALDKKIIELRRALRR